MSGEGNLSVRDGDALGQVAWLVHIVAAQHSYMVGQQLQWHDVEDRLQWLNSARHL